MHYSARLFYLFFTIIYCHSYEACSAYTPCQSLEQVKAPPSPLKDLNPSDLTLIEEGFMVDKFRVDDRTRCSGSHQFTHAELLNIMGQMSGRSFLFYDIDLREEPHLFLGYHANVSLQGSGANSYNGCSPLSVQKQELNFSWAKPQYRTEGDVVRENGGYYVRIPVTDATRPEDKDVQRFVDLWRNRPQNTWFHFHCMAGKGRTTTFMALAAMLSKSSQGQTFEQIAQRQYAELKGENLLASWYSPAHQKRERFLRNFHRYATAEKGGYKDGVSWLYWASKTEQFEQSPPPDFFLRGLWSDAKFAGLMAYWKASYFWRSIV